MALLDSIDKIVTSYFTAVTCVPFVYRGKRYEPRVVVVSPGIFRGFTCPAKCGGCCPRFSLDYLGSEVRPEGLKLRLVDFNNRKIPIWSDLQLDHTNYYCRNLRLDDGRCGIHGRQPFSCDFELMRFLASDTQTRITTKLFGRGWNMQRVDGERGALCTITPPSPESQADAVRKLKRLFQWATHFQLPTCVPEIIEWVESGPHEAPGYFNGEFAPKQDFGFL